MSTQPSQVIVITWAVLDGSRATGRSELRDGCWRAVFEIIPLARAVVWSRDLGRLAEAQSYANANGYIVRVLDDTRDVLSVAKALHVAEGCLLTT